MNANSMFKLVPISPQLQKKMVQIVNTPDQIQNFNVSIDLINSKKNHKGQYEFLFANLIAPVKFTGLGSIKTIRKEQLKAKLEAQIKPADKKYIKLDSFTNQKSVFIFNIESWLNDAFYNVKGRLFLSKWDKEFKIRLMLPHMVRIYAMRMDIEKYIAFYFKEYIAKHTDIRKDLMGSIPEGFIKFMGLKPENLFDYTYSYMDNKIICRLKPQYVGVLLYQINKFSDKKLFGYGRI